MLCACVLFFSVLCCLCVVCVVCGMCFVVCVALCACVLCVALRRLGNAEDIFGFGLTIWCNSVTESSGTAACIELNTPVTVLTRRLSVHDGSVPNLDEKG